MTAQLGMGFQAGHDRRHTENDSPLRNILIPWEAWLAQMVEHAALYLRVVSSIPTLRVKCAYLKK